MTNIFTAPTQDETAQQMADSIPQGRAWAAKNIEDSNVRKLINSLSVAPNLVQQKIEELELEFNINNTTLLISEWETSVGIPDECDGDISALSLPVRRQAVIEKLKKEPIVDLAEIQAYVDSLLPDNTITMFAGLDYTNYPGGFPAVNKRYLLVAEIQAVGETYEYVDYEYPYAGAINTDQFECKLNKVIPSNVVLLAYYSGV